MEMKDLSHYLIEVTMHNSVIWIRITIYHLKAGNCICLHRLESNIRSELNTTTTELHGSVAVLLVVFGVDISI